MSIRALSVKDENGWRMLEVSDFELEMLNRKESSAALADLVVEHGLRPDTVKTQAKADGGLWVWGKRIDWAEVEPPELTPKPSEPKPPVVNVTVRPAPVRVIRRGWLW